MQPSKGRALYCNQEKPILSNYMHISKHDNKSLSVAVDSRSWVPTESKKKCSKSNIDTKLYLENVAML